MTSFEYYDKKNKTRVTTVKNIVLNQMSNLLKIEGNLTDVKEKLQKNEQLLKEYEEMQEDWAIEKQKLVEREVQRQADARTSAA